MRVPELYINELAAIETSLLLYYRQANSSAVKELERIKFLLKFKLFLRKKYVENLYTKAAMIINERKTIESVVTNLLEKLNESTGKKQDESIYLWKDMKVDILTGRLSLSSRF